MNAFDVVDTCRLVRLLWLACVFYLIYPQDVSSMRCMPVCLVGSWCLSRAPLGAGELS
jgi:hypothetical protein